MLLSKNIQRLQDNNPNLSLPITTSGEPLISPVASIVDTSLGVGNWQQGTRFAVNSLTEITHLGTVVTNPNSGIVDPIQVKLSNATINGNILTRQEIIASVSFSSEKQGVLVNSNNNYIRYQQIPKTYLPSGNYLIDWSSSGIVNKTASNSLILDNLNGNLIVHSGTSYTGPGYNGSTFYAASGFGVASMWAGSMIARNNIELLSPAFSAPTLMYTTSQGRDISGDGSVSWIDSKVGVVPGSNNTWNFYAIAYQKMVKSSGTATAIASNGSTTCTMSNTNNLHFYYGGPAYQDPVTGRDIVFIHEEKWQNNNNTLFYGTVGIAINDAPNSTSFNRLGTIIQANIPKNGTYTHANQFGINVHNGYIYVYHADRNPDTTYIGCAISRCLLSDFVNSCVNGNVPQFFKYYNGSWTQSGIGGLATGLDSSTFGNAGPEVKYISEIQKFVKIQLVATTGTETRAILYISDNGLEWYPISKYIENETGEIFYPTIFGAGSDPRVIGRTFHVVYSKSVLGSFDRWQDLQVKYVTVTL